MRRRAAGGRICPPPLAIRYIGIMSTDWAAVYTETYSDLVRFLHRKVWDIDRAQDLA